MNIRLSMIIRVGTLVVVAALSGCSSEKASAPSGAENAQPVNAATPQAALRAMTEAILKADKGRFTGCLEGTPEQIKAMQSVYDYSHEAVEFREALIKAYGKEGWAKFQDSSAAGGASARLDVPDDEFLGEIDKGKCEVNGDAATLMVTGKPPMALKKTNGAWRIDAAALLPPDAQPAKFAEMMTRMGQVVKQYKKAIGKPGVKPEDLNYELGREICKQMMGVTTTAPHRFEIDKF